MRLVDAFPGCALNAPGRQAEVVVELDGGPDSHHARSAGGQKSDPGGSAGPASDSARSAGPESPDSLVSGRPTMDLVVELRERQEIVASASIPLAPRPGSRRERVPLTVPATGPGARGYEVMVYLRPGPAPGSDEITGSAATDHGGALDGERSTISTALLVAEHWREAPRYGFLSEFAPEDEAARAAAELRVENLAKLHITIVQFYDWMYRHYDLVADSDEYVDAMGRELSLSTVRHRIAATHDHGMAAMAYGAVYGPEPEFISSRPEWLLYDSAGAPIHLIELFYITDLRAGGGWREHIINEFEEAVTAVEFDGIHLDQYGFPKLAYDYRGELVDLAADFPSLIDEAAERVAKARPGAAVIFNAVNDWPMDTVASSDQAAVYIEVWAPHTRYRDLVTLARRARDLSRKQVILSAYLQPFREGGESAEWSLRYATAVIAAAGAHHLVMGEGSAVLRDPYYPNHGVLSEDGFVVARRYYDHTASYTHYLHATDLKPVEKTFLTGVNTAFTLSGARVSTSPEAGSLYVTCSQRGGQFVLNLVNLCGLDDDSWDVHQLAAPELRGLVLEAEAFIRPLTVTWASPDEAAAGTRELQFQTATDGRVRVALPPLTLWATLVIDHE